MKKDKLLDRIRQGQTKFKDLDIEGDYAFGELDNITFTDCFIVADFKGSHLDNTVFNRCNLKTSTFRYCTFVNTLFRSCSLEGCDFTFADLQRVQFENCYSFSYEISTNNKYLLATHNEFGFNIEHIERGWLVVRFFAPEGSVSVTASRYLGIDPVYHLLRSIENLLTGRSHEAWILWPDEPGAVMTKISSVDKDFIIEIYHSQYEASKLAWNNDKQTECEKNEPLLRITENKKLITKEIISSITWITDLYGKEYYTSHWFDFPTDIIERLIECYVE